jgi:hypothetical protein
MHTYLLGESTVKVVTGVNLVEMSGALSLFPSPLPSLLFFPFLFPSPPSADAVVSATRVWFYYSLGIDACFMDVR